MLQSSSVQEQDSWVDFDYKLVEIIDQDPVEPSAEVLQANPKADKLDVNGKKGQTVSWVEEEEKFLVETFDGDLVAIAQDHLREYEPPAPQQGGFHVAMPRSDYRSAYFPAEVSEILLERQYCVVQATSAPTARRDVSRNLLDREGKWVRLMPEVEDAYMGRSPGGNKIMWLDPDTPDSVEDDDGLSRADGILTVLSTFLGPMCPAFGFEGRHRTNGIVHASCSSSKEEAELLEAISDESSMATAEEIQTHLSFIKRRKICMMFFAHGSGGTLILHPGNGREEDVYIPCKENQIVVFRHDLCDYTFQPAPGQLCVQAWILREAQRGEAGINASEELIKFSEDIEAIPDGPVYGGTSKETVDCMSLGSSLACSAFGPENYWALLSTAADGGIRIPHVRWDHDMYFEPNPEAFGKAYAQHFGMLDIDALQLFNSDFFGITAEESAGIEPHNRVLMEVGYDTLYRAGWTKKSLKGVGMGICIGTAESEFCNMSTYGCLGEGISPTTRMGTMPALTVNRLHYIFGMQGPTASCETACSSALSATCVMHHWMRPQMPDQHQKRTMSQQVYHGMAGGSNAAYMASTMVGFCGAHMLSLQGRCFTFDQSGDGFLRAEGIGTMYYKTSQVEDYARLAMLVSSQQNQDGRSASLTAPHGPSQQECIRLSLREANVSASDIQVQELHGTGTALGDPIETGSLRATMMVINGVVRDHPLMKTSSKTNFGHTELAAGICGIMKCCLLGIYAVATPNLHLRLLNPHIDDNAYPVLFTSEFVDQGRNANFCGVSSFGWSGCNARGDLWSRCLAGPRNTEPGGRLLELTRERVLRPTPLHKPSRPPLEKPKAGLAFEDVEEYTGEYKTGWPLGEDNTFYMTGSFNGWALEPMQWLEDKYSYAFAFQLGEARIEQFRLVVNKSSTHCVFPAAKMADLSAPILGPGVAPPGHNWVIDGRELGIPPGTVYMVYFGWDDERRRKRLSWEPSEDDRALNMAATIFYRHRYSLVASWNVWKPVEMKAVTKDGQPGYFESHIKVGLEREEQFHFLRDGDPLQAIYPARGKAVKSEDMRVCGPDHKGEDMNWKVSGRMGEAVTILLRVWEGEITVTTTSVSKGIRTWTNDKERAPTVYYVSASWNEYGLTEMVPEPGKDPKVFTLRVSLKDEGLEAFQIVVDRNFSQVIHPEMRMADQLLSQAVGPDAKGEELHWAFYARHRSTVDIKLDLSQVEVDPRKVVSWTLKSPLDALMPRREGFDPTPNAPQWKIYEYER